MANSASSRPPGTRRGTPKPSDGVYLVAPGICPAGRRVTPGSELLDAEGRFPDGGRAVDGECFVRWLETGEGDPWATSSE